MQSKERLVIPTNSTATIDQQAYFSWKVGTIDQEFSTGYRCLIFPGTLHSTFQHYES